MLLDDVDNLKLPPYLELNSLYIFKFFLGKIASPK